MLRLEKQTCFLLLGLLLTASLTTAADTTASPSTDKTTSPSAPATVTPVTPVVVTPVTPAITTAPVAPAVTTAPVTVTPTTPTVKSPAAVSSPITGSISAGPARTLLVLEIKNTDRSRRPAERNDFPNDSRVDPTINWLPSMATPEATPPSIGASTATPAPTTAAKTAVTAVLRIAGDGVWPFDNNKITYLTAALASSMTTIDARDINTISAVQTVSNSSRRLLADSSADITTQLNAGSTSGVTAVATELTRVASDGSLLSALKSKGVSASSINLVSAVAAGKIVQSNTCVNGAINGICLGTNPSKVSNAAIIAIAVVGGVVLLVLLTVLFCCCRSRYKAHQAAAIGAVPDKGPKPKPATPNAPEPFSVNYPQFQSNLGPKQGSYIPPRTVSKGKSGGSGAIAKGSSGALNRGTSGAAANVVTVDASAKK